MPTRQQLLDQYWQQQARIGVEVSARALTEWSRVNPVALQESGASWLALILSIIRGERRRSRQTAMTFYRLYRAMETGYAPRLPDNPTETITSLRELEEAWAREADIPLSDDDSDFTTQIQVEDFEWPDFDDDADDRAAIASLVSRGVGRVHTLIDDLPEPDESGRGRLDDPEFLADLESAGRGAAQAADREALRSGRDLMDRATRSDKRVLGWARVTDGNPCAFCAMLAARGAVYKSRATAEVARSDTPPVDPMDLSRYHNGCHCQMVPVYDRADFLTPESRRLSEEWRETTRGLSGADARRAWRRHIEGKRRTQNANLLRRVRETTRNG